MKTATITYHYVNNYGALLQAYALQQIQLKMSVDNVIINYCPNEIKRGKYRMKSVKEFLILIYVSVLKIIHHKKLAKQNQIFYEFTTQQFILTKKYHNLKELKEDPPEADLYIAGSDQLWNLTNFMEKAYFLDFGDDNTKRASYAVSMGTCKISKSYHASLQRMLSRFDFISVREKEAMDYIEWLLPHYKQICQNFDPVFLLSKEEWTAYAQPRKIDKPYILCIPMGGHPLIAEALKRLQRLTGYQSVIIATDVDSRIHGDLMLWDVTPFEYIDLIQKAEYVLTPSFHATAFCTLFNIKFYSFIGNSSPGRIPWLLNRLGLSHRMINRINEVNTKEIDFTLCNQIIDSERASSMIYLQSLFIQ